MAVTLNLTVSADGFPFPPRHPSNFSLYIQFVAPAVSAGSLWHVSCELPSWQEMNSVVLSAEFELLTFFYGGMPWKCSSDISRHHVNKVEGNR